MSDFFSRLGTNVIARQQRDPRSFDSGFASGVTQLAGTAQKVLSNQEQMEERGREVDHQIEMQEQQRARSHHTATMMGEFAELQVNLDEELEEARKAAPPGAPGYAAKADEIVTMRSREFLAKLKDDPEIQDRFGPMIANVSARAKSREMQWGMLKKGEFEGEQVDKHQNVTNNRLYANPDMQALGEAMQQNSLLIGDLDLDGNSKEKKIYEANASAVKSTLDGMIAQGQYNEVDQLIQSGELDQYLNADRKEKQNYTGQVAAGRRAEQAEAERAASEARDALRDQIRSYELRINAGELVDPKELQSAYSAAQSAGIPIDELTELGLMTEQVALNRTMQGQTAAQKQAALSSMEALNAAGKATPFQQRMIPHLRKVTDEANKQEAEQYKGLLAQGQQGRLQILSALPADATTRFQQAEKIEPGLGWIANLGPGRQQAALAGQEVLAANKDFFDRKAGKAAFAGYTATAALGINEQGLAQYQKVADNIYAQMAKTDGVSEFSPERYRYAVKMAFGSKRENGQWKGGLGFVRQQSVLLPSELSSAQFDEKLSRQTFQGAFYADGAPAQKADVLKTHKIILDGVEQDGRYRYSFRDRGGSFIRDGKKQVYYIRVYNR